MVDDIITALSHFKALFVIARNSSFTYKGRAVDVKRIGRELGVRYVLEGSVRKAANRVRITGQLVDIATGAHLWAERFDGGLSDIFDLQDQVTEKRCRGDRAGGGKSGRSVGGRQNPVELDRAVEPGAMPRRSLAGQQTDRTRPDRAK